LGAAASRRLQRGQLWQEFQIEEDFYAAADARLPSDEASAFEREHHLVN
jgi:hypothetical protein